MTEQASYVDIAPIGLLFVIFAIVVVLAVVVLVILLAIRLAASQRGRSNPNASGALSTPRHCSGCGANLAPDAPHGLCPACLLKQGLSAGVAGIPTDYPRRGSTPVASEAANPATARYRGPFTAPTPAELAPLFPQLEIVELLGQGGMGAVYKARQPRLDRTVALKILPLDGSDDPTFAERFMREARTLARLDHPGIVRLHDFGESGGLHYFVMEYVDGSNLRQLMKVGGLTRERALAIVPQVCDALQFAHDEGVIHRDIKPENILLDRKGRVKIADFGLAKLLGRTPADPTLTGTHQVMGTPHYMAPEQVERPLTVDARADVYALGVVFYEMLTGELPLGQFAPPSQKSGGELRVDSVVLRALAREPERRFSTAREMKAALFDAAPPPADSLLSLPSIPAGPVSLPFEISNFRGGLGHGTGIARIENGELILEYQVLWFGISMLGSGVRETRIPLTELQSVSLRRGWFSDTLVIRTTRLSALSGVPMSRPGEVTLDLSKKDAEAVDRFVARVAAVMPVEQTPRPSKDATRLPRGQGLTIAAIFVALAGAVVTFVPVIQWASFTVRAYALPNPDSGRAPTPAELQDIIESQSLQRLELVNYFGIDYPAGIVAGVAFLALPLLLIATFNVKRGAFLRPLTIFVFGAAVVIAALCYREEARSSHHPTVTVNGGVIPEKTADGKIERCRGPLSVYVMGRSLSGNLSATMPATNNPEKVAVLYSLGDHEFVLPCSPPVRAYGAFGWQEVTHTLNSRLQTRPATGIYAALGLGVALLFLAAAQFLVLIRSPTPAYAVGDIRHPEPMTADDHHPGRIRSFAGRLYSLVFESRAGEEPAGPYRR